MKTLNINKESLDSRLEKGIENFINGKMTEPRIIKNFISKLVITKKIKSAPSSIKRVAQEFIDLGIMESNGQLN